MRLCISCIIAALTLSGCAQLVGHTPSFQYCSDVSYARKGNQIDINAKCQAPLGSPGIPAVGPGL
jgi:uncharacterized protein YceK